MHLRHRFPFDSKQVMSLIIKRRFSFSGDVGSHCGEAVILVNPVSANCNIA